MGTAAMFPEKETRIIEKKTCKTIMILRVFSDIDAVVPRLSLLALLRIVRL